MDLSTSNGSGIKLFLAQKISTHSHNAHSAVSRLKTGKTTWLGAKYLGAFQFLPLGLGRPQRRWMPGMPRAVLRTPLDTLTREGGSQGVNGRISELVDAKRSCL